MKTAEFKVRLRRALDANKQTLDAIEDRVIGMCLSVAEQTDCFEVLLSAGFHTATGEPHDPVVLHAFNSEDDATAYAGMVRRRLANVINLGRKNLLQIFQPVVEGRTDA